MPKRARCPYCDRLFNRDVLDAHVEKCRTQEQVGNNLELRSQKRKIVVDGNNVAYHLTPQERPQAQNLALAYYSLTASGFDPIFVVSAALDHTIDSPSSLDSFMMSATVIKAPQGTNDDLKIIQLAKKLGVEIVSNDRFLDWIDKFPWLTSRLRRFRMTPSGLILTM
ncbi:MAG: hypothetical protein AM326_08040 [Candidatus Thorarchaeota archaeon SMTZ-45]|nr:MAG: hypothetical protein AM325_05850 [Candidatus Thorarchaeota archaeon SMTZ1-45]KXH76011.1 MAG: hypothetical protein AM326_08040 [Candidatus Thorarchaeota archaeon SMTZ-45]